MVVTVNHFLKYSNSLKTSSLMGIAFSGEAEAVNSAVI